MITTQKAQVLGAKRFKGEVEGRSYDNCKVRIMLNVPGDAENECGYNVTEVNYGKSDLYHTLKDMKFPFMAELHYELEVKSGRMAMVLKDLNPIQVQQQAGK